MVSPENTGWLFDYGMINDSTFTDSAFTWPTNPSNNNRALISRGGVGYMYQNPSSNVGVEHELEGSLGDSDGLKDPGSKKRGRPDSCAGSSSKACREKFRRDRLNDKFVELGSILEPGRPPKTDKSGILIDAVRMVTQLRGEAQKLKDTNISLQDKIKELKAEKNELRDEKQRLKAEKENLEQQVKSMSAASGFMHPPPAMPAAYAPPGQASGNKLISFMGYPGVAICQFMPPAATDTSQDHVHRSPVA